MRRHVLAVALAACVVSGLGRTGRAAPTPSLLVASATSVLNFDVTTGAALGAFTSGGPQFTLLEGLALAPDRSLYVSDFNTGRITHYDGQTGAFITTLAVLAQPGGLAIGPDNNLYVGTNSNSIVQVNTTTGAANNFVTGPTASVVGGLAFGGGSLFVTYLGTGQLIQYNATTGAPIATLYNGFSGNGPRAPAFGPDGNLYVPEFQTQFVDKFAAPGFTTFSHFISDPAISAMAVAFGPDGNMLVLADACCGAPASVRRYDIHSATFLGTLVGPGSGGLTSANAFLVVSSPAPAVPVGNHVALWLAALLLGTGVLLLARRARSLTRSSVTTQH